MSALPALFDANASFGTPCTGGTDSPSIADRLAFMDRFGIGRSLVWNVESAQDHALAANRKLIAEVRGTPGAEGRIVPALAVSGHLAWERGGPDRLADQVRAAGTRALRFVNAGGRLALAQLAPVVRGLRRHRPFLVLRHDQAATADILEFAAAFPWMTLVLTEVMWGACGTVFDLMRRRRSILCDTSWLHSFGAIELAVERFGAGRLLFGTGYRSHNGAAVAALARARLTDDQRRAIAHGNLDRLCGLAPAPSFPARWTANTLWPRFLEGGTVDADVVDAHGHLGPSGGYLLRDQEEREQLPTALAALDRAGIGTMIASGMRAIMGEPVGGNELLEEALRPHAGRLGGYVAFNPFFADVLASRFDRWFSGPVFIGFKTLCGYWKVPVTDRRFLPMWSYAARHRLPVLCHTWSDPFDAPSMLRGIARRFPAVPILVGHAGGDDRGRAEAEDLAREHANVFLEWCGSFCSTVRWEDTLRRVDPRRVVFGTDAVMHDVNWELGRLLSLEVPDRVLVPILGANMRGVLGMRRDGAREQVRPVRRAASASRARTRRGSSRGRRRT